MLVFKNGIFHLQNHKVWLSRLKTKLHKVGLIDQEVTCVQCGQDETVEHVFFGMSGCQSVLGMVSC